MKTNIIEILSKKLKVSVLVVTILTGAIYQIAFATPPSTPYAPGETISPTCTPGSSNCTVKPYAVSGANSDITSVSGLTTPLTTLQGGTGLVSYTAGDILYASATNTISKLSAGANAYVLTLVNGLPSWMINTSTGTTYLAGNGINLATTTFSVNESQLSLSNLGGVLGVTKGGSGTSTAFTAGSIIFSGASGVFSQNNTGLSWDNISNKLSIVGTIASTHIKGLGSTPNISAGTGSGTGGITAPIVSVSGTDSSGEITVTSGNGVLSLGANVFTLTFSSAYTQAPHIIFSPANSATALLSGPTNVFVTNTASTFSLVSGTAALTLLTTYKWTYQVIE